MRWTSTPDEENEMMKGDVEVDEEARRSSQLPAYPVVLLLPATAPIPVPVPSRSIILNLPDCLQYLPSASPLSSMSSSHPQIFPLPLPDTNPPSYHYHHPHLYKAAATSHSLPLPPPFILSPTRPDAPPPMPTSAPTSLPPLLLPSASRREDRPEVNLPPRKRLGIALGPRYEVGESSAAATARPAGGLRADYGFVATMDREIRRDPERDVGYGIMDSWDEIVETLQGAPVSTDTELGAHMREFESMVRRDTDEIYTMLDDDRAKTAIGQSERLGDDLWMRVILLVKRLCHYAPQFMHRCQEQTELQSADRSRRRAISDLLETDRGRRAEMRELRAADRARQQQIIQTLTVMQILQREMIPLQGLVTTLQGQVTALQGQVMALRGQVTTLQRQQGPAGGPAQLELP
ncbi:hypothetical protein Tco_0785603 [Tanacetum coccineum]